MIKSIPTTTTKVTYIPYMGDHSHVVQAGFEAYNMPAEVLPPPDEDTLALGVTLCKGRECLPCLAITGDVIRRAQQPDFDPARAVIFIPSGSMVTPCLLGQYPFLHHIIFEQHRLDQIEIVSLTSKNGFYGMGERLAQMRQLLLKGVIAVDLLTKLLHEHRPYEQQSGMADQCYQQALTRVLNAIRQGSTTQLLEALQWTAHEFEALPVDRNQRRPIIGLVGDIYVRLTPSINQDIVRRVEAMGGEVWLSSMMEWINFSTWEHKHVSQLTGMPLKLIKEVATNYYQQRQQRRLARQVKHLLTKPYETPMHQIVAYLRPYYEPALGTESVVSLGSAIDYARHGLSGIIHAFPFSCMPGLITTSIITRIRNDLDHIPWLDIGYDGQEITNIHTRLEAFVHQAAQFQRRHIIPSRQN